MASKTSMPEVDPTPDLQEKLHQDLYREIFKHSPEPIAIIEPAGRLPGTECRPRRAVGLFRR